MTFTTKLTRDVNKGRPYSTTARLAATIGHLVTRNQCSMWNTLKDIWQPGTVLNRPQPMERPLAYKVDIQGTIYQRTREHLRPRSQSEGHVTPSAGSNFPLAVAPVHSSKYARIPNIRATRPPQLAEASPKGSTLTPDQLPHSKLPCREKQADLEPAGAVATSERTGQPKAKLLGRDTSPGSQQSLKIK